MRLNVDITVTPTPKGGFRCKGTVDEVQSETNPAESVAAWLGSLNAKELESVALERQGMGTSFTATVLETLGRWARGDT